MMNGFSCGSTFKEEQMISFKRLPILLGAVMMMATAAFAQTSGTVTINGSNPEAFSLTDTGGAALSATVNLGVLTPASTNTLTTSAPVTVRMRSNKVYKVTAQASALTITGPGAVDGGNTITLQDIGFGVTGMTLTGTNVANSGSRTETLPVGFDVSGGWPVASNGLNPAYSLTLNDITTPTQVLAGTRISKKGNLITDNNFISVSFGVAVLPQFFTPNTGFSTVITLTMASQ
jgi:hypothetical protein